MKVKDALEAKYKAQLEDMLEDLDYDEFLEIVLDNPIAADSCHIEADGTCAHGYSSPLLLLDMI